jgi:hypothetical protein
MLLGTYITSKNYGFQSLAFYFQAKDLHKTTGILPTVKYKDDLTHTVIDASSNDLINLCNI